MTENSTKYRSFIRKSGKLIAVYFLLFGINLLVRLPIFLSKNIWFDGDEAIVGLMAQDFLQSGKLPFFFYGQNYGFASFEILITSFFEKIMGASMLTLKFAALAIHAFPITLAYVILKKANTNKWIFILVMLVLILSPTYILWGLRGSSLPFFWMLVILYFCLFCKPTIKNILIISFVISVLALSQVMFLFMVLPFILKWLWKEKNVIKNILILCFVSIGLSLICVLIFKSDNSAHLVHLYFGEYQLQNIQNQLSGFIYGFSNYFYFSANFSISLVWKILILINLILLMVIGVYHLLMKFERILFIGFILSTILFLFLLSLISITSARYWIPFFTFFLLLLIYICVNKQISVVKQIKNSFSLISLCIISLISLAAIINSSSIPQHFYHTKWSEKSAFYDFEKGVKDRKIKALYSIDPYLQWQWNYLNGAEIPCSGFSKVERSQRFKLKVNSIYETSPDRVGIIGFWGITDGLEEVPGFNDTRIQIGDKYCIVFPIKRKFLEKGWQFNE